MSREQLRPNKQHKEYRPTMHLCLLCGAITYGFKENMAHVREAHIDHGGKFKDHKEVQNA